MAPVKRKADGDSGNFAKSKKPQNDSERANKRRKSDAAPGQTENQQFAKPAAASILKSEEKAFPRGGASVLTPLEHKQIQRQAEHDVLFEQAGTKSTSKTTFGSDDEAVEAAQPKKSSKKRRKSQAGGEKGAEGSEDLKVKIESVNFKVSESRATVNLL